MTRPLALVAALLLYLAGVWAVATTPWSAAAVVAVPAPSATALPAAPGTSSPRPSPSASGPWTLSTLRDHLVAELNATDPAAALADLERITRAQPLTTRFCHPVAHELGHAALVKYHGNFAKAASYRNDVCGSGYLHGIVEEKLASSPNPVTAVTTLCAPEQTASCIHGIGHGAMFVSHLDVSGAEALCDRFPQVYQAVACSEGIFMQLFEPDESDPAALAQLPAGKLAREPLYPCPEQPAGYQSACYFYAPVYFLQSHDYADHPESFVQALDWCRQAPSSAGRNSCTMGTGSRLMKYNIDRPGWTGAQCLRGRAWQQPLCVSGMVSYWNVNYHDHSARAKLCPQLSGAARDFCRAATGGSTSAD
ncbi:hypothetical protein ACFQZC_18555 [Streptacidiphilus monticola]